MHLYRAIDSEGNTIDFYLSESRDKRAAKRFFKKALAFSPDAWSKVLTDCQTDYCRNRGYTDDQKRTNSPKGEVCPKSSEVHSSTIWNGYIRTDSIRNLYTSLEWM